MRDTEWICEMLYGLDLANNNIRDEDLPDILPQEYVNLKNSIFKPINKEQMNNLTKQRTEGRVTGELVLNDDVELNKLRELLKVKGI